MSLYCHDAAMGFSQFPGRARRALSEFPSANASTNGAAGGRAVRPNGRRRLASREGGMLLFPGSLRLRRWPRCDGARKDFPGAGVQLSANQPLRANAYAHAERTQDLQYCCERRVALFGIERFVQTRARHADFLGQSLHAASAGNRSDCMRNEGRLVRLERLSEVRGDHFGIVEMIGRVELPNAGHRYISISFLASRRSRFCEDLSPP